jgi:hypothetical protein
MMRFEKNRRIASHCPCRKSNHDGKFSPFEGFVDKGHCFSCGETFFPDGDNTRNEEQFIYYSPTTKKGDLPQEPETYSILPKRIVEESKLKPERNVLLNYLSAISTPSAMEYVRELYQVGTSMLWPGSSVFWQIDINGNVRTGKIIQYEILTDDTCATGQNCKRVKTNKPPAYWVHKLPKVYCPVIKQCFFGEHLLSKFPDKKIGILESEKSALIASLFHPEYLWLACGGVSNLSREKLLVLRARDVFLFPDLKQLDPWKNIVTRCGDIFKYKGCLKVINVLEKNATDLERQQGFDLADYLLRENWHTYKKS